MKIGEIKVTLNIKSRIVTSSDWSDGSDFIVLCSIALCYVVFDAKNNNKTLQCTAIT